MQRENANFAKARKAFKRAKGAERYTERNAPCPTCDLPMRIVNTYRAPAQYWMRGICSADPDHNLERYGYYSTEGTLS